jgi:hypothetical protein
MYTCAQKASLPLRHRRNYGPVVQSSDRRKVTEREAPYATWRRLHLRITHGHARPRPLRGWIDRFERF